jgi:hypothetical protein
MPDRSRISAGVGLLAALTLGAAGCTADSPGPSAGAGPSGSAVASAGAADPAATAALAKAAGALDDTSFRLDLTSAGITMTGQVDAPRAVASGTLQVTGAAVTVESVLVDKDLYVKIPGLTPAGKWTHVDVARLPQGANLGLRPGQLDPVDTQRLLGSATDVRAVGSNRYQGTLDLTRATGVTGLDKVTVDGWGAAASSVPFTAELDPQGRLSVLNLDLPGQPPQRLTARYSGYGTPVTVQRPAVTEVTEAPEGLYQNLPR